MDLKEDTGGKKEGTGDREQGQKNRVQGTGEKTVNSPRAVAQSELKNVS